MSVGQAARKTSPVPAERLDLIVNSLAAWHHFGDRWVPRERIARRARLANDAMGNAFSATLNTGLVENRGFGNGDGPNVGDVYRLTDKGWEASGRERPLWL